MNRRAGKLSFYNLHFKICSFRSMVDTKVIRLINSKNDKYLWSISSNTEFDKEIS